MFFSKKIKSHFNGILYFLLSFNFIFVDYKKILIVPVVFGLAPLNHLAGLLRLSFPKAFDIAQKFSLKLAENQGDYN